MAGLISSRWPSLRAPNNSNRTTSHEDGVTTGAAAKDCRSLDRPSSVRAGENECRSAILVSRSGRFLLAMALYPGRRDVTQGEVRACSETLTGGKRLAWPWAFRRCCRRRNGSRMFAWNGAAHMMVMVVAGGRAGLAAWAQQVSHGHPGAQRWRHSRTWAVRS